jgi:P-type Ca2+ transporter type 2B
MFIRLLCTIFISRERSLADEQNLADVLNAFIVAITVIVMAIPEGLPLAVAICLAFSVGKLQHQEQV